MSGFEKWGNFVQNMIFCHFLTCQHSKPVRALAGFSTWFVSRSALQLLLLRSYRRLKCKIWYMREVTPFLKSTHIIHYSMLRPNQIKYLFHGSSRLAFIALGKILLIDGCGLACMAGQRLLGITTIVPCQQLNWWAEDSSRLSTRESLLEVVISTVLVYFLCILSTKVGLFLLLSGEKSEKQKVNLVWPNSMHA